MKMLKLFLLSLLISCSSILCAQSGVAYTGVIIFITGNGTLTSGVAFTINFAAQTSQTMCTYNFQPTTTLPYSDVGGVIVGSTACPYTVGALENDIIYDIYYMCD